MELVLPKEKLQKASIILLVVIGLAAIAFRVNWGGAMDGLFSLFQPAVHAGEFEDEPALSAVKAIFAPGADQSAWEESVCANMTKDGCQIFKTIYAKPLFDMPRGGVSVTFVKVADELDDGTKVWLIKVVPPDGNPMPVYAHVSQNESGDWVLIRVLFDQETEKYANPTP
ncbi:MAG: hypothetical protein QY332_10210 [Anaerolineales bacterium]|nr:MAG: hypothetical protein QY332_10210 [Anaerolineales bacterium]